jgi:hypothetical protein
MWKGSTDLWECDGCGTEITTTNGEPPAGWFELSFIRTPKAEVMKGNVDNAEMEDWHACSRKCLPQVFAIAGKFEAEKYAPEIYELFTLDQQLPVPVEKKEER